MFGRSVSDTNTSAIDRFQFRNSGQVSRSTIAPRRRSSSRSTNAVCCAARAGETKSAIDGPIGREADGGDTVGVTSGANVDAATTAEEVDADAVGVTVAIGGSRMVV